MSFVVLCKDLLREMPELAENLTFQNYQAKMDALLYCEEVDAAMELDRMVYKTSFWRY